MSDPLLFDLPPPTVDNKFHAGNGDDGKHYWLTPPDLYARLNAEFAFDFDPCPFPKPADFDGLTDPWGASNYVNPPFGSIIHEGRKKGMTAWVRKAIAEQHAGKQSVLVYPIDKWVLMLLAAGAEVRNLGDVRWLATEDGTPGNGTGRHIACFVLRPALSHPPSMSEERRLSMSTLDELRKRVEAATGPDREIDALIAIALGVVTEDRDFWAWRSSRPKGSSDETYTLLRYAKERKAGLYTASLDAALALVERKLPGWTWVVGMGPEFARASLSDVRDFRERHTEAHAPTPALALIAALLKAQSESLGRPEA